MKNRAIEDDDWKEKKITIEMRNAAHAVGPPHVLLFTYED